MTNRFKSLDCPKCGSTYPANTHSRCLKCGGILEARYSLDGIFPRKPPRESIWDFADFLPPTRDENVVSLGEGWTPYVAAPALAKKLGLRSLRCKIEGCNPTGSFKDRAASLGISLAKEWGKKGVFTASDGNAAAAISAYSARAHIKCLVLLAEHVPAQKLAQIIMYSPLLLRVGGLYSSVSSLTSALERTQAALPDWLNHFIWAPFNPLLVDPYKTIAYEIAISNNIPDRIFVPVAGGELLTGLYRGFSELKEMGEIEGVPRLVAVQGKGADPIVQAIEKGLERVVETNPPKTVAGALRVNFGVEHPLAAVRESGGFGVSVSDEQILDAQKEVAREEGIFCEVSSAAALAAISEALDLGKIGRDESVAVVLTGAGLKDYPVTDADMARVPSCEDVTSLSSALTRIIPQDW
jgi:threonine synthase